MEAYVAGVSTRGVVHVVAALGISSGISKSEVSRVCAAVHGLQLRTEDGASHRMIPAHATLALPTA